jgi:hypothetical protein
MAIPHMFPAVPFRPDGRTPGPFHPVFQPAPKVDRRGVQFQFRQALPFQLPIPGPRWCSGGDFRDLYASLRTLGNAVMITGSRWPGFPKSSCKFAKCTVPDENEERSA